MKAILKDVLLLSIEKPSVCLANLMKPYYEIISTEVPNVAGSATLAASTIPLIDSNLYSFSSVSMPSQPCCFSKLSLCPAIFLGLAHEIILLLHSFLVFAPFNIH